MDYSNDSHIMLRNVQYSNAGSYKCEVSGDEPIYETDYKEANMTVIGEA